MSRMQGRTPRRNSNNEILASDGYMPLPGAFKFVPAVATYNEMRKTSTTAD